MFFVAEIQIMTDGSIAKALFDYPTLDAAKQAYHYFLSANIGADGIKVCSASIVDERMVMYAAETWTAEEEE